ncbi:yippee-domain-containing protein [Cystobasidium minutum MCA 4210]|uniref:yippee-domain-containing protein n=1 Tax=Cystobasidium minutum MCA 4210 TaxID=1397322 RepID=UPI0034CD4372|eukprot:jgi/Rhomi1/170139/fgenesh1_kg.3_\
MGFKHKHYLAGSKVYSCSVCRTHMATIESMISRRFNGQHGQAYLFDTVFNVVEAGPEDRQMTTGLHRVRDISCKKCGQVMGWKYERAYEQSQKYKEGKSILEKALLVEAAPPSPSEDSLSISPSSNGASTSVSPGPPGNTIGVIGSMIAGGELISSLSPTIGPRAQLINVDTSTFTTSSTSEPSSLLSTYAASSGVTSRLGTSPSNPSFRSGSSISIRSATNSEASEDSELADAL